jgi:hypothetical protein
MNTVWTDDPDASWTFTVTDGEDNDLDWTPAAVAAGAGTFDLTATWLGDVGPVRKLKVDLDTLAANNYTLYLQVPGGNDVVLGTVAVRDRS